MVLRSEIEVTDWDIKRGENICADVRGPRLAANFFDEVASDSVIGIGVSETSAGRPANVLGIWEFLQDLQDGNVRRVFCVVGLAKGHVVEAGGVLEKIGDADGIRGLPRVFERNVRRDVLQAGLQIDAALFFEFEKRERDECFAEGADAEFGVASDVPIL